MSISGRPSARYRLPIRVQQLSRRRRQHFGIRRRGRDFPVGHPSARHCLVRAHDAHIRRELHLAARHAPGHCRRGHRTVRPHQLRGRDLWAAGFRRSSPPPKSCPSWRWPAGVFLFSGTHDWSNFTATAGAASGGLSGFGAAMFAALWAYSGWQFLPDGRQRGATAGSQSAARDHWRHPARAGHLHAHQRGLSLRAAALAGRHVELHCLPRCALGSRPTVQTFLGAKAAPIAALIFLVSSVGALNGTILARARVPYAAARDGLFLQASAGSARARACR